MALFVPLFAATLGTSYLVSEKFRRERCISDRCERDEGFTSSVVDGMAYGTETNLPTLVSDSLPSTLQPTPNIIEGRDTALTEVAPSLPDPPKGWVQPQRRLHWTANHESERDPGVFEFGNAKWTFNQQKLSRSIEQSRLPMPDTRNFVNSDREFVYADGSATGQVATKMYGDGGEYGYEYSQYLMTRGLKQDPRLQGTLYPHLKRKTEPEAKSMPVKSQLPGYAAGTSYIGISEPHRKNINPVHHPIVKNVYGNVRLDPDVDYGLERDRTIEARTPYVRGMARPTRPAILDLGVSMHEDKVLPGRQPGVSFNQSLVRKPFRQPLVYSDPRRSSAEEFVGLGRANTPQVGHSVTQQAVKQAARDQIITTVKQGMEHNLTWHRGEYTLTGTPGYDTRSDLTNRPPIAGRHDIYTDYYIKKVTEPWKKLPQSAVTARESGFHDTTNLNTDFIRPPFLSRQGIHQGAKFDQSRTMSLEQPVDPGTLIIAAKTRDETAVA